MTLTVTKAELVAGIKRLRKWRAQYNRESELVKALWADYFLKGAQKQLKELQEADGEKR